MSLEATKCPTQKPPGRSHDNLSGFLGFLIALPLCMGISLASGWSAVAGVLAAIAGSLVCALISDLELTIKGSAADLNVKVLGAVSEFKILFGKLKTGILSEFLPTSTILIQMENLGGGELRIIRCSVVSVLPSSVHTPNRQQRVQIEMPMSERTGRMLLMRRPVGETVLRVNNMRV